MKHEIYQRIRRECKEMKGQANWAKAHGMSAQYLSDVLSGKRDLGPLILQSLKLKEAETLYALKGTKVTKDTIIEKLKQLEQEKIEEDKQARKRKKALEELKYE